MICNWIQIKSPNKPTIPQEKIRKITSSYPNNIKAPFYDPRGKEMLPIARLTLRKVMTRGAQCPNGYIESDVREQVDSTLFDRNDYSDPLRRKQLLAQEQSVAKKSRVRSKEMKFIGMNVGIFVAFFLEEFLFPSIHIL